MKKFYKKTALVMCLSLFSCVALKAQAIAFDENTRLKGRFVTAIDNKHYPIALELLKEGPKDLLASAQYTTLTQALKTIKQEKMAEEVSLRDTHLVKHGDAYGVAAAYPLLFMLAGYSATYLEKWNKYDDQPRWIRFASSCKGVLTALAAAPAAVAVKAYFENSELSSIQHDIQALDELLTEISTRTEPAQ